MKDIAIYGAGGFGREVASLFKRINKISPTWNFIGFFDDDPDKPSGSCNEYGEILGGMEKLNSFRGKLSLVLAIGKPYVIKKIVDSINNPDIDFPNIIAPEAYILDEDTFSMGRGNIICSFTSMSCNVKLGDFNIFNNRVSLGHDVEVGSFNSFMTAVRISGNTVINTLNFFGVASVVIPGIKVGVGVTLSPNSVLMRKPKNNTIYVGNPAKIFDFK